MDGNWQASTHSASFRSPNKRIDLARTGHALTMKVRCAQVMRTTLDGVDPADWRRTDMRRAVGITVLALAAVVLQVIVGCASPRTPTTSANPGTETATETAPLVTSVKLPPQGVSENLKPIPGGATLSLRLATVTASVNETVTAKVTYSNPTSSTVVVLAPGGAFYNVRVTSADGTVVFDSWPYPQGARLPLLVKKLLPGKSMSGRVSFALRSPGTYAVVAYLNGPATPPVTLTVSP